MTDGNEPGISPCFTPWGPVVRLSPKTAELIGRRTSCTRLRAAGQCRRGLGFPHRGVGATTPISDAFELKIQLRDQRRIQDASCRLRAAPIDPQSPRKSILNV